jgi:hypothetical protein
LCNYNVAAAGVFDLSAYTIIIVSLLLMSLLPTVLFGYCDYHAIAASLLLSLLAIDNSSSHNDNNNHHQQQ